MDDLILDTDDISLLDDGPGPVQGTKSDSPRSGLRALGALLEAERELSNERQNALSELEVEFVVRIDGSPGERLGIDVDHSDGRSLLIMSVSSDGSFLLPAWNLAHPEQAIKPGDRFVSVNNRQGNVEQLLEEIKGHSGMVEIKVRRLKDSGKPQVREPRPEHLFRNGARFLGQWLGPMRDGTGLQVWADGAQYDGEWLTDQAEGRGKFMHADGDFYEGEWRRNKAHGTGTYIHADGSKYVGQWDVDRKHGAGREEWADGAKYVGMYDMGQKEGPGTFIWPEGSRFDGQFTENSIQGIGVYTWADGRTYNGQWVKNKMHGRGLFRWSDGRTYEGDYCKDQKHGHGTFSWPDGRSYDGQWRTGKQHGSGAYQAASGERRTGIWDDGKRTRWADEASGGRQAGRQGQQPVHQSGRDRYAPSPAEGQLTSTTRTSSKSSTCSVQ